MYAKKVKAVQWMDRYASGDQRRHFKALYVFDDGFPTEAACKEKLKELGYTANMFAMVRFCGQWYAVNITGYINFVVVSAENVIYQIERFSDDLVMLPLADAVNGNNPAALMFDTDDKKWAEGIEKDLRKIDNDIRIKLRGKNVANNPLIANNVLVTLGREFFRTEICIRTKGYVQNVFSNYYNDRSMEFVLDKIERLRCRGEEYYNPFTGETSRNVKQRDKKAKEYIERCSSFDDISDEEKQEEKKNVAFATHEPMPSRGGMPDNIVSVSDVLEKGSNERIIITIHGVEHYVYMTTALELYHRLQEHFRNLSTEEKQLLMYLGYNIGKELF